MFCVVVFGVCFVVFGVCLLLFVCGCLFFLCFCCCLFVVVCVVGWLHLGRWVGGGRVGTHGCVSCMEVGGSWMCKCGFLFKFAMRVWGTRWVERDFFW